MGETLNILFHANEDNTYEIRIKESWSGHTVRGNFIPPYTSRQLNALQKKLSKLDSHDHELRALGCHLFSALCGADTTVASDKKPADPALQGMLHDVIQRTLKRRGTVALMLEFGIGCDEFVRYPWELLHNGDHFLLVSGIFTLSRVLLRPDSPVGCELPVHPPFRILYIAASPSDCAPLETERSFDAMQQALAPLIDTGQIFLDRLEPPTFSQLVRYLSSYGGAGMLNDNDTTIPCYAIHFDGHGAYGRLCPTETCETVNEPDARKCRKCETSLQRIKAQTYLCFCDDEGMNRFIGTQSLRDLLLSSDIRLAVFSACETAMISGDYSLTSEAVNRSAVDATLATALVTAQVPAVVAMPFSLQDDLSPTFMYHFYEALAEGRTLEEGLARSRQAMLPMQQKSWFIPVLYRRVAEGEEMPVPLLEAGEAIGRYHHPLAYLHPPTHFVGRQHEVQELAELLTAAATGEQRPDVSNRLRITGTRRLHHIVLTGPAGIGKSALAYETIRLHRHKFPGGILGISLRKETRFTDAMLELMRRLHLPLRKINTMDEAQRLRLVQGTLRSLASRELPCLLLLDGFEEVQDQTELDLWHQFLSALPQETVVLATSHVNPGDRTLIGGAYRWYEYRIQKMSFDDIFTLATLLADESGLDQRISLDETGQQRTLRKICQLLDGYPLGAELIFGNARSINDKIYTPEAATRSLDEIREDLSTGIPLAGLQALLEISYQRLSMPAHQLLTYLAAFKLAFKREQIMMAVRAMAEWSAANGPRLNNTDLEQHWREARDELVQTSFILFNGHSYAIHSQIANFALSHLTASERQFLHRTIAQDYLQRLTQTQSSLSEEEWFATFEHLEQAGEPQDLQTAIHVAAQAAQALQNSIHTRQLFDILQRAAHYVKHTQDHLDEGRLLCGLGGLLRQQGHYAEAENHLHRSLELHRQHGDNQEVGHTLLELATLSNERGDYPQTTIYAQQAHELFQETTYIEGKARLHLILGEASLGQDYYTRALEHIEAALVTYQLQEQQMGCAQALLARGQVSVALGRYAQAFHDYEEAYDLFTKLASSTGQARVLFHKAAASIELNKIEQAETTARQALIAFQQPGHRRGHANALRLLGHCLYQRREWTQAHEHYHQAYTLLSTDGNRIDLARVLIGQGELLLEEGKLQEAQGLFEQARTLAQKRDARRVQGQVLRGLGDAAHRLRQYHDARRLYQEAQTLWQSVGSASEQSSLLLRLGMLCEEQKAYHEALDYWVQSLTLNPYQRFPPYSNLQQRINVLVSEQHLEETYNELRTRHNLVQGHA